MPILSTDQIVTLAANAGFSGPDLATATAVALAESSGDPVAYNPEGSYGLWQIYLKMHPEFSVTQVLDPQGNAQAAYQIYLQAGSSFRPWSTYNSGRYMGFMGAVTSTIAAMTPPTTPDQTPGGGDSGGGTVPASTILPVMLLGAVGLLLLAGIGGGK